MKKFLLFLFFLSYSFNSTAHMAHYNKFNKIEMEILRDGEVIGYNYYFFKKDSNEIPLNCFVISGIRKNQRPEYLYSPSLLIFVLRMRRIILSGYLLKRNSESLICV